MSSALEDKGFRINVVRAAAQVEHHDQVGQAPGKRRVPLVDATTAFWKAQNWGVANDGKYLMLRLYFQILYDVYKQLVGV